jgi:hypothetical protein
MTSIRTCWIAQWRHYVDTREKENELPVRQHRKGQLVLALGGA